MGNFFSLYKRNFLYKFRNKINIDHEKIDKNSSLDKLFTLYNTDKANKVDNGTLIGHGFAQYYEKHLNHYKTNNKINILEIGSFSGATAASFVKYFPNAEIFCLDINILNFKFISDRIHLFGLDVTKIKMLDKFLKKINFYEKIKKFDIIIDDGSHLLSHQLIALDYFYKFVKNNGYYIIEDYKFPNYFKHLNDVNEYKIDEIILKIKDKKFFESKIISKSSIKDLIESDVNIFEYKGNKNISNIVFLEKKQRI